MPGFGVKGDVLGVIGPRSRLVAGLVAPAAAVVIEVIYAAIRARHAIAEAIAIAVIDAVGVVVIVGAVLPILRIVFPVL